jgi:hypothetical protein
MRQGFTPDQPSFERILCAAFMIQQMNEQVLDDSTREATKTQEFFQPAHILPAREAFDLEAVLNQAELALALHAGLTLVPSLTEKLEETDRDPDNPLSEFSRLLLEVESEADITGDSGRTSLEAIQYDREVSLPENAGTLRSKELYLGHESSPESSVTRPIEAARFSNRIRTFSFAKFKQNLMHLYPAAAPVAVLVTIVVFLFFTIMDSHRSEAAMAFPGSGSSRELLRDSSGVAASETSQSLYRRLSAVPPTTPTHMRVTDPDMSKALDALSWYEFAGLRQQALYGDDSAAFLLGLAYETGHMVPQNCAKAAEWIVRSANQGNAAAQFNLGLRYRYGDGVPIDEQSAATWLAKAAAKRSPEPLKISRPIL